MVELDSSSEGEVTKETAAAQAFQMPPPRVRLLAVVCLISTYPNLLIYKIVLWCLLIHLDLCRRRLSSDYSRAEGEVGSLNRCVTLAKGEGSTEARSR